MTNAPDPGLYLGWARGARGTAIKNHNKGDLYGEVLANTRADVYDQAAELVRQLAPPDAAAEMMNRAKAAHVRTPPMIDFDSAGVQYATARAWQFCARTIEPDLPEIQTDWA
jgi:hypothetical protein